MTLLFWFLLGLLAFNFLGYGLLVIVLGRLFGRPHKPGAREAPLRATLLIAAHNEEQSIGAKLDNALEQDVGLHKLNIMVVSDGSTDRTVAIAEKFIDRGVRLVSIIDHAGKIGALNQVIPEIDSDVVIFSDANSMFERDSLRKLLQPFTDPGVGGVCGQVRTPAADNWIARGEALYWRYDHAVKKAESLLSSTVSAQGSIYAVRRELLGKVPDAVADDFYQSVRVVAQGKRLLSAPDATSRETVTEKTAGEFGRRVRSTERGWRGLMINRELMNPFRFGIYSFQLISHKLLRRLAPFLLVALLFVSALLSFSGPFYAAAFYAQLLFYSYALAAYLFPLLRRLPGAGLVIFFCMGHLAMMLGVINALRGKRSNKWVPVR